MTDLSIAQLARRVVEAEQGTIEPTEDPECSTKAIIKMAGEPRHVFFDHHLTQEISSVIAVGLLSEELSDVLFTELASDHCPFLYRVAHEDGLITLRHEPTVSGDTEADLEIFANWLDLREAEVGYLDSVIARILARLRGAGEEPCRASFVSSYGHA